MQITLDLDEALFTEVLQLTNLTTQEDLIYLAVLELVRSRKKNLLDLAGRIQFYLILTTRRCGIDCTEISNTGWISAARIYYDLRRRGFTVRSPIDCCIAQVALANDFLLIHNDQDFETIALIYLCPI